MRQQIHKTSFSLVGDMHFELACGHSRHVSHVHTDFLAKLIKRDVMELQCFECEAIASDNTTDPREKLRLSWVLLVRDSKWFGALDVKAHSTGSKRSYYTETQAAIRDPSNPNATRDAAVQRASTCIDRVLLPA